VCIITINFVVVVVVIINITSIINIEIVCNSVDLLKIDNHALSTKLGALEREYQKVQKSLNRSKKAKDIDLLLNENENLQGKLEAQEDDFRLQNQTLLRELSAVSEAVVPDFFMTPIYSFLPLDIHFLNL
jgi:hypothetical protein